MKTIHALTLMILFLIGSENTVQTKDRSRDSMLVGTWKFEGSEILFTHHKDRVDKWLTDTLYFYEDHTMKFSYRKEDGILRTHHSKWKLVNDNELVFYERKLKHSITEELPETSLRIDMFSRRKLTLQSPIFNNTNAVQVMNVYFRKIRD
ncbi:hypothetical protein [Fulvivirga sedimenti]|uniref:Lipocalin-like domain-containing protein n=1 Tax=Fulvivirga sedimenti TaxID=2879465 RepID=A0A9X1KYS4_9BACT|nr:hypothetical protein [Fulvivirga sedimenti]MCA6075160.1 hypothetical protein [Fulvivirga sedimenti]MCA6076337.1 hypothetical protein [Fulvivirga sedimenti]MCA6077465.1 hypothetical protein [Fulvivirga sedimenti]